MGMFTMFLGILQPINAIFRPHAPKENEDKTAARVAWEHLHKKSGYTAVIMGLFTVSIGTTLAGAVAMYFMAGFALTFVVLIVLCFLAWRDRKKHMMEAT